MSDGQMCCARVFRDTSPWSKQAPCKKKSTVERDGKHYCGIHDPVSRQEKQAARNDKLRKKMDEEMRVFRIRSAAPDLLEALQEAIAVIKKIKPPENGNGTIVRGEAAIRKATGEKE